MRQRWKWTRWAGSCSSSPASMRVATSARIASGRCSSPRARRRPRRQSTSVSTSCLWLRTDRPEQALWLLETASRLGDPRRCSGRMPAGGRCRPGRGDRYCTAKQYRARFPFDKASPEAQAALAAVPDEPLDAKFLNSATRLLARSGRAHCHAGRAGQAGPGREEGRRGMARACWRQPACLRVASVRPCAPARSVAVTIDDLPAPAAGVVSNEPAALAAMTAQLLAALAKHRVPAVGFVNEGKLVRRRRGAGGSRRRASPSSGSGSTPASSWATTPIRIAVSTACRSRSSRPT